MEELTQSHKKYVNNILMDDLRTYRPDCRMQFIFVGENLIASLCERKKSRVPNLSPEMEPLADKAYEVNFTWNFEPVCLSVLLRAMNKYRTVSHVEIEQFLFKWKVHLHTTKLNSTELLPLTIDLCATDCDAMSQQLEFIKEMESDRTVQVRSVRATGPVQAAHLVS